MLKTHPVLASLGITVFYFREQGSNMSFWLLVEARGILVTVLVWMVAMILVLVGLLDPSWIMAMTLFCVMTLLSFTFLLGFAYMYSMWKQKVR